MSAEIALARSSVYGFLSAAFSGPEAAMLAALRKKAAGLEQSLVLLGDAKCVALGRELRKVLARQSVAGLRAAHLASFGHTVSKECPPYEAEYDQAHLFQKTQTLADIAGFYRAFGLETAADEHERADHVSVELEFMHFLCVKEACAIERGASRERIAQCGTAQAKFLGQHLAAWAGSFARRLHAVAREGPYAAAAELLEAYLAAEVRRLGVGGCEGGRLNEATELPDETCAVACGAPAGSGRNEVFHDNT